MKFVRYLASPLLILLGSSHMQSNNHQFGFIQLLTLKVIGMIDY